MKYLILIAALIATPIFADEASKRAKAAEFLELVNGREMQTQTLNSIRQMMQSQGTGDSELTSKLLDLVQGRMEATRPALERIYADSFSEEELDNVLHFYRSPAGKAVLAKMPEIMQKTLQWTQDRIMEIRPEIERIAREAAEKNKVP